MPERHYQPTHDDHNGCTEDEAAQEERSLPAIRPPEERDVDRGPRDADDKIEKGPSSALAKFSEKAAAPSAFDASH